MAGTEPSPRSRVVLPLLIVLGIAASFAALAFVRFSRDLDGALVAVREQPGAPSLDRPIGRALSLYADPLSRDAVPAIDVPARLAASLWPGRGRAAGLRRRIYSGLLLLRYPRHEIWGHYMDRAPMGTVDGTPTYGFHRASGLHFGVSVGDLSLGEALLLCDLAAAPRGHPLLTDFSAALERRNRLLTRLRDAGLISVSEYADESSRPLSPGSDHRPIW